MAISQNMYRNRGVSRQPTRMQQLQARPRMACSCGTAAPQPMGALGMSVLTKVLRASTPGPNSFKLASTPKEVKKVIAVAGPALAAIPGWGTVAAAGAAVITKADQMNKAKRLQSAAQNAGDANALLAAYGEVAGQIPGRVIGLDTLKQIMNAIGATGGWPNVKKWKSQAVDDVFVGCKGCTPPTIPDWVKQQLAAGSYDPMAMVPAWNSHVNSTWGSKWLVGSAGQLQNQVLTDVFDYEVSQFAPQAPQTYGVPAPDQTAAPAPSATPSPTPAPSTAIAPSPAPVPTTGPAPVQTQVAVPVSATDPNLQAYVKALMDQGASQQQAFTAALDAIGRSGQPVTPQTQAQVAEAVQSAASPIPASMLYVGAGLAGLVILGLILRKKK